MKVKSISPIPAMLITALIVLGLFICSGGISAAASYEEAALSEPAVIEESADAPGELVLSDDDGDGIIPYKFNYNGATVYSLIILDPSRVFVGTAMPDPNSWGYGITLDAMAAQYGAVAGINAGGFLDQGGAGNGWPPSGITYSRGINFNTVQYGPIAGLDRDNKMWAGYYDYETCEGFGIRDAVCFGPALVVNGNKIDPSLLESGIGARTAIGQREDGSIVMVVIDGRQGYSIGVSYADCANIMADKFACVNAANMDGGNSSCMYLYGSAVNRSSNQAAGTRNLPDAWLVSALPENYVRPEGVPDHIVLYGDPLGEKREYEYACDQESCERMYNFACVFAEAYYGYFGTQKSDYYYPTLMQYVVQGSDLHQRMDLALMDRMWVNTWRTDAANITLNGAFSNGDGTYDIIITSDIYEQASYWNYEAPGTTLRITVADAPESKYGYIALSTY